MTSSRVLCLALLGCVSVLLLLSGESRAGRCDCGGPCEEAGYDPVCGREGGSGHTYNFPNACYMRCASQCLGRDYKAIDMSNCYGD